MILFIFVVMALGEGFLPTEEQRALRDIIRATVQSSFDFPHGETPTCGGGRWYNKLIECFPFENLPEGYSSIISIKIPEVASGLPGIVPESIGHLTHLRSIEFIGGAFESVPENIGTLPFLESLTFNTFDSDVRVPFSILDNKNITTCVLYSYRPRSGDGNTCVGCNRSHCKVYPEAAPLCHPLCHTLEDGAKLSSVLGGETPLPEMESRVGVLTKSPEVHTSPIIIMIVVMVSVSSLAIVFAVFFRMSRGGGGTYNSS